MFFWRIARLKQELVEQPLSSRGELPYLIAYVVLSSVVLYIPYTKGDVPVLVDAAVATAIAAGGTVYVYRQNGGGDGRFFLQRYFSIGWVVAVRFAAALLLIYAVYAVSVAAVGVDISEHTPWYETLFLWFAQAVFFNRLALHTADVARRTMAVPPGDAANREQGCD